MAGLTYESEGRIVSCLQKWLDRHWRRGKIPAKAKASLCNGLLAAVTSSRGGCDPTFLRLTDALYDTLEDIRHTRSRTCTDMFINALVTYVGKTNAALDACGATCPRIAIPLSGGGGAEARTAVKVPAEHTRTDRTLVPAHNVTPVEIDTKGLGETVVRIVILDGKVTCDITQKRK